MAKDMARRHRIQAGLSVTGATLGLSALGTKGGAVATRSALKRAPEIAQRLRLTPKAAETMDKTSLGLVTSGAGVGGISGLTFAANERALARREEKVAKSAFGVVHKAVFDLDAKRDEAAAKQGRVLGQRRERDAIAAGRFLKYGEEREYDEGIRYWRDDKGKLNSQAYRNPTDRKVADANKPAQQRKFKTTPKPAAPPKRQRYSGLDPENRRQRRMRSEQYGMAGGAGAAVAASGGLGYASYKAGKKSRRLGMRTMSAERAVENNRGVVNALAATRRTVEAETAPVYQPNSRTKYEMKPLKAGQKVVAEASRLPDRVYDEAGFERELGKPVETKGHKAKVRAFDSAKTQRLASIDAKSAYAGKRVATIGAHAKELKTSYKAANRLKARTGRAAVVAGGTALALGAGAAGVRHMRRNQGKTYRDWWDG